MDLVCVPEARVDVIASMTYIGFGISGFFFFPLPDLYGRRTTLLYFMLVHLIVQVCVLLVPVFQVRMVCYLLMGMCQIKNAICAVQTLEVVPTQYKGFVVAFINSCDCLTSAIIPAYFYWLDRNWFPIYAGLVGLTAGAMIFMFFQVPESPRWLLQNNRK